MDRRGLETISWIIIAVIAGMIFLIGWKFGGDIRGLLNSFLEVDLPKDEEALIDVEPGTYTLGCPTPGIPDRASVCKDYEVNELCYVEIGAPCSSGWPETNGVPDKVSCGVYTCEPSGEDSCTQVYIDSFDRKFLVERKGFNAAIPACDSVR